jgi:hypothetical protein
MAASSETSQKSVQPRPFNHDSLNHDPSRPAQQRREGIKVPDILAAEFSRLTLLFGPQW